MQYILTIIFALSTQLLAAQVHYEYPPQHKGDTTVYRYKYALPDSLLACESCVPDLRTIRLDAIECVNIVTDASEDIQLESGCYDNLINQGSTQAEISFRLPDAPQDGQLCRLVFHNAITDLTITTSGGSILLHSAATTSTVLTFKYFTEITTWKRIQ